MAQMKLTIRSPQQTKEVFLNPQGASIGRGQNCDVILDHSGVSRMHARIFQDPFGRWIVEDLGSHNGVLINGQQIKAQALQPGQEFCISNFTLSLSERSQDYSTSKSSIYDIIPIVDKGATEDIIPYRPDQAAILSPALVQHLNEFTGRLLTLTSPSDLYNHACSSLAGILNTLVAIVRLPSAPEPLGRKPDILSCCFGRETINTNAMDTYNLHFSKRVLDAVRSTNAPVMAKSKTSDDVDIVLTVTDDDSPNIVYAARVNDLGQTVDALYIEIPEYKSSKEMFDFVEAVARQVNFVQKNLFFNELQKQEKAAREANIQLKEKDRIKDEYVSRVTHDIKGHLAAIQSCLYVAANDPSGTLDDQQSEFLGRARRRTRQLSDFVAELLNLTQMRLSGKMPTSAFSLPETISKALTTVERKANDKSIKLTSNVDSQLGQIVGNEFSINEMITNLLFNAIKYTPDNKTVHLEAKDNNDHVRIDFVDTGIGIPADELSKVFEEFFRAANAKENERDGSGLGLSIVKQIIDRHKGEISVQSELDEGTTFTVILPKTNP